jgi:hypothetical protein
MNYTNYGDNPFQPGVISHDLYTSDQLIAGDFPIETQPILVGLPTGAQPTTLVRGTVLGLVSVQSIEVLAGATNTGNGVPTGVSRTAGALNGAYAIGPATDATHFPVTDPEGNSLAVLTVGAAYSQSGLNITIPAGSTPFVVGDSFTVTTEDATGTYRPSIATASDGSQNPSAILLDTVAATTMPQTAGAYLTGEFNERRITYDPSWALPVLRAALRPSSIFLKSSISGTPPY